MATFSRLRRSMFTLAIVGVACRSAKAPEPVIAPAIVPTAPASAANGRFVSPDRAFSVKFPTGMPNLGGTVPNATLTTHYFVNDGGTMFSVATFENEYYQKTDPTVVLDAFARMRFDGWDPGFEHADSVVRLGARTGRWGRISGTWNKVTPPETRERVYRVFIREGRLYEVWVFNLGTRPIPEAAAKAFIESFRLCDAPGDC